MHQCHPDFSPIGVKHLLSDYDASFVNEYGDDRRLTAVEREFFEELTALVNTIGMCEAGKRQEAIDILNKAIQAHPQPSILTHRARMYVSGAMQAGKRTRHDFGVVE